MVFGWSIYNGATYYVDVFGKRFQTELEALRRDVAKWQSGIGEGRDSPPLGGGGEGEGDEKDVKKEEVNHIPLLDSRQLTGSTGLDGVVREGVPEWKQS